MAQETSRPAKSAQQELAGGVNHFCDQTYRSHIGDLVRPRLLAFSAGSRELAARAPLSPAPRRPCCSPGADDLCQRPSKETNETWGCSNTVEGVGGALLARTRRRSVDAVEEADVPHYLAPSISTLPKPVIPEALAAPRGRAVG